jgi:hypothetical protein
MGTPSDSEDDKRRMAWAVHQVFERWHLEGEARAVLLGLVPSDPEFAAWRDGGMSPPLPDRDDVWRRCGMIFGIFEVLTDFWSPGDVADRWMTTRNRRYGGRPPLAVASEGLAGLERVYRDLQNLP